MQTLFNTVQNYPVKGVFRIARDTKTQIDVVEAHIGRGGLTGRGECRPYARYDETPDSVISQIETIRPQIESGAQRSALQDLLPAGAARNALDCAFWDLEAKAADRPVWTLAGLPPPQPLRTAFTLSLDTPEAMAKAAKSAAQYKVLKIKIGRKDGLDCAKAIMTARPDAELIVDANEALDPNELSVFRHELRDWPVLLIEQPVRAGYIDAFNNPDALPILCADEALHEQSDLARLWAQGYRAVNIKLDKCGGLTAGICLMREAKDMGFVTMAGCMVGSSLAMAPMFLLAQLADIVDLDGPALLSRDINHGLKYKKDLVFPPSPELWG
ncbi:dipeptide epimerase [Robiginitomaculum antarcticum]|uniref:dipeptide epimerase n=1 Tax=Robiginitomaculum antarcticum TaxID=437507 RepID=UPI0003649265|nr:dipeptide epimerase [Robiginitomaculum antarcticum]